MERPRKVGAKFSNKNIAADEYVQPELSVDYDGKRDRWESNPHRLRSLMKYLSSNGEICL